MATKKALFKHLVETVDENYKGGKGLPLNRQPLRPMQKVAPVEDLAQTDGSTGSAGFLNETVTITGGNAGSALNVSATATGSTASYSTGVYTITIPVNESLIAAHLLIVSADVQTAGDGGGFTNWVQVKFVNTHGNTSVSNIRVPQVQKLSIPTSGALAEANSASVDNDNNPLVSVVDVSGNDVTIRVSGLSIGAQGFLLSFTGF